MNRVGVRVRAMVRVRVRTRIRIGLHGDGGRGVDGSIGSIGFGI